MAEDLAAAITMLYEDAELSIIERLTKALAQGIDSPLWAEIKLRSIGDLREAVEQIADALQQDANGAVARALAEAYGRGRQAAVAELGALDIGRELQARRVLPNTPAVDRLAASYAADTRPLYVRITRAVVDTYRNVVSRVASGPLLGTVTRRQASQRALDQFAQRGVTGFVDRAGRSWELGAYAEMAVRSVTARAAIEGHTDALAEIGVGLVIVSDAPLNCPLCAPWEGEVLSLSGPAEPHTVREPHAIERRRTVAVHVAGSLLEARRLGLFHPNCRLPALPQRVLAGSDDPSAVASDARHHLRGHPAPAGDRTAHPSVEAPPGLRHGRAGTPRGQRESPRVAGRATRARGRAPRPTPQARARADRLRALNTPRPARRGPAMPQEGPHVHTSAAHPDTYACACASRAADTSGHASYPSRCAPERAARG
jgi:hypothetical protein